MNVKTRGTDISKPGHDSEQEEDSVKSHDPTIPSIVLNSDECAGAPFTLISVPACFLNLP